MYQPIETLYETKDRLIYEGWEEAMKDFKLRPLTTIERHQFEREMLAHRQAQETPFVLGEPLYKC